MGKESISALLETNVHTLKKKKCTEKRRCYFPGRDNLSMCRQAHTLSWRGLGVWLILMFNSPILYGNVAKVGPFTVKQLQAVKVKARTAIFIHWLSDRCGNGLILQPLNTLYWCLILPVHHGHEHCCKWIHLWVVRFHWNSFFKGQQQQPQLSGC